MGKNINQSRLICKLCGGDDISPIYRAADFDEKAVNYQLVQCGNCCSTSVHPELSRDEISNAYDNTYYYRRSVQIRPGYPHGILRLSKVYLLTNDYRRSIKLLETIIDNREIYFEVNLLLAKAYSLKDPKKGLQLLSDLEVEHAGQQKLIDEASAGIKGKN